MWGHQHAARLPSAYPQFFARAQGARIWDVDGNAYIDLMCSWGPIILGHHAPEVEEAVRLQSERGDCMNGPSEAMVELAELLVDTIPHADWAQFQKNGTDATTAAVTIARAATGRRKILVANGAYHGAAPWCLPSLAGGMAEDRAHIVQYEYNDVASLHAAADWADGDLAGIVASAFRHDLARDQEMPTAEFARAARALCDATGAALILDDVRAGFRLHLGGSWEPYGVRPDLSAWSKAIANGYPLAAVTGCDRFRDGAASVFSTGSFWTAAVPMAAAVATLHVLRRGEAIPLMERLGTRLRQELANLAEQNGLRIRQTGPVQMPMLLFEDDPQFQRAEVFCNAALAHGAYLHPRHNMFLSAAHTDDDIDIVLDAAGHGFAAAARVAPPAE
ncbi:MAG: aminotransferase class III-fold pyridoxal phosphate-dependent enzyme [Proteobacteria bacterium]|nr:aminotransferase class III-fold pyridoxal phosphate-dependent enzyme [Pseudomonadota bacterium]